MRKRLAAWIIVLCFALWGPMETVGLAIASRPAEPSRVAAAGHGAYCHCSQCVGELKCCCRPTKHAAQTLVLLSRCNSPQSAAFVAKVKPPVILPVTASAPVLFPLFAPRFPRAKSVLRLHASRPLEQPPRFV